MATDQLPALDDAEIIRQANAAIYGVGIASTNVMLAIWRAAIAADRARAVPEQPILPDSPTVDVDDCRRGTWVVKYQDAEAWAQAYGDACFVAGRASIPPAPEQAQCQPADLSGQAATAAGERIERLKFEVRQAMIEYGSAIAAGDQNRIRSTSEAACAALDALAELAGRASLSTPASGEGWMPIETAPTNMADGPPHHAIVASPLDGGGYYVEEAWYDTDRREWWPANTDHTDAHGAAVYPTHWRPLPPAPTSPTEPAAAMGGEK